MSGFWSPEFWASGFWSTSFWGEEEEAGSTVRPPEIGRRDLRKKRRAEIERQAIATRRRREAEFFLVGM